MRASASGALPMRTMAPSSKGRAFSALHRARVQPSAFARARTSGSSIWQCSRSGHSQDSACATGQGTGRNGSFWNRRISAHRTAAFSQERRRRAEHQRVRDARIRRRVDEPPHHAPFWCGKLYVQIAFRLDGPEAFALDFLSTQVPTYFHALSLYPAAHAGHAVGCRGRFPTAPG